MDKANTNVEKFKALDLAHLNHERLRDQPDQADNENVKLRAKLNSIQYGPFENEIEAIKAHGNAIDTFGIHDHEISLEEFKKLKNGADFIIAASKAGVDLNIGMEVEMTELERHEFDRLVQDNVPYEYKEDQLALVGPTREAANLLKENEQELEVDQKPEFSLETEQDKTEMNENVVEIEELNAIQKEADALAQKEAAMKPNHDDKLEMSFGSEQVEKAKVEEQEIVDAHTDKRTADVQDKIVNNPEVLQTVDRVGQNTIIGGVNDERQEMDNAIARNIKPESFVQSKVAERMSLEDGELESNAERIAELQADSGDLVQDMDSDLEQNMSLEAANEDIFTQEDIDLARKEEHIRKSELAAAEEQVEFDTGLDNLFAQQAENPNHIINVEEELNVSLTAENDREFSLRA